MYKPFVPRRGIRVDRVGGRCKSVRKSRNYIENLTLSATAEAPLPVAQVAESE